MAAVSSDQNRMKKARIGERNQRIVIEQQSASRDETGQVIDEWVEIIPAWSKVRHQTGSEIQQNGRIVIQTTYWFLIDWHPNLHEAMRIKWNGQIYGITNINDPDGQQQVLKITAFRDD